MYKYLQQIWHSKDLRKKILFTLGLILVFRLLSHITIPNVNSEALKFVFDRNALLGAFSLLTGGSSENFSIVLMGLSPYINASIIIQLLTVILPKMEEISKEGEQGQKRLNRWTRWLTLPLAFIQSYGMITLINAQAQVPIIENLSDPMVILPIMLTVTVGTLAVMWLGEVITEKGIGNGISILIFAGILAAIPNIVGPSLALAQTEPERILPMVAVLLITLLLTVVVIMFTEGQRRIPVTYGGQRSTKMEQSFLPIRVNQAGMVPIIFAVSVVTFPSIVGQFLLYADSEWIKQIGRVATTQFSPSSLAYIVAYFLLTIGFTYFYVSITFKPEQVAENIQKRGGFIPGLRPGKETAEHLAMVSNRLNLFGGLMVAGMAVLPMLISMAFTQLNVGSVPMLIGGSGIIIVVGVVLDLIRRINADMLTHHYDRFYKG